MLRRIAVVTALTTVSAALVCGVAQADDDGNSCVHDTVYNDNRDYSSDKYEFDDLGKYSGDHKCPKTRSEGSATANDADEDAGRFDDDVLRDTEDDKGGRGGKAGYNSSDCAMPINRGGSECENPPARDGSNGPDRLVF